MRFSRFSKKLNIAYYYLTVLRPNIKKRIFQNKEVRKCSALKSKGWNILFGVHPVWENTIRKAFDKTAHTVHFEELSTENISFYDLVVPLTIDELIFLNDNKNLIQYSPLPIPSKNAIQICNDKFLFYQYMSDAGLGEYFPETGIHFSYPYTLKKKVTHFGIGSEIVFNEEDEQRLKDILYSDDYFTQQYIPGKNEYAAHILFEKGEIVSWFTIKHAHATEFYIRGHNKAKTIVSGLTANRYQSIFSAMLRTLEFEGICCIDYKIANGKLYILEINPRIGASSIEHLLHFVNALQQQKTELLPLS